MVVATPCVVKAVRGLRVQHDQVVGDSIVVVSTKNHQIEALCAAGVEIYVDIARSSFLQAFYRVENVSLTTEVCILEEGSIMELSLIKYP